MRETLLSTISRLETFLKPPTATTSTSVPTPQSTSNPTVKIQSDLKPVILTKEANPEELNEWLEQYRSYYSMSKMEQFRVPDQQATLLFG